MKRHSEGCLASKFPSRRANREELVKTCAASLTSRTSGFIGSHHSLLRLEVCGRQRLFVLLGE